MDLPVRVDALGEVLVFVLLTLLGQVLVVALGLVVGFVLLFRILKVSRITIEREPKNCDRDATTDA